MIFILPFNISRRWWTGMCGVGLWLWVKSTLGNCWGRCSSRFLSSRSKAVFTNAHRNISSKHRNDHLKGRAHSTKHITTKTTVVSSLDNIKGFITASTTWTFCIGNPCLGLKRTKKFWTCYATLCVWAQTFRIAPHRRRQSRSWGWLRGGSHSSKTKK